MRTNTNKCKGFCIIVGLLMLVGTTTLSAGEARIRQKESKEAQEAFESADLLTEEDFEYDLTEDGNGIRLTKYIGKSSKIRIPDEIDDMPVVELGEDFNPTLYWGNRYSDDLTLLEVVYIPDTVKNICPFRNASNLKYIRISENIKEIPDSTFAGCSSLEEIYIPDSVKRIGSSAFMDSGLKTIDFPDKVLLKSSSGFNASEICSGCRNLTKVVLPVDIKEIPSRMFKDCTALTSIEIPNNVTVIEDSAFSGCTALSSIIFPKKLTTIERYAFAECTSLSEITLPETVKTLGNNVFQYTNLIYIYIPDSVISIGDNKKTNEMLGYVDIEAENMRIPNWITWLISIPPVTRSINLPSSLKELHVSSKDFENLEDIIIPDSLKSVKFSEDCFSSAKLPLKTQKRLHDLGYTGKFGGTRPAKK